MVNKVLFVSNIANFSKFNRPFMRWFKQHGWQVDYVSAGEEKVLDCDNQYAISLARSPYSLKNFMAYKELKTILLNGYSIIHCHTPVGGFLTRIAARKGKAKVIYTAHGFHFYKGAPLLNWLIYYPVESFLEKYTDCLVTVNEEDFCFAYKNFKRCQLFKIDGVGVDLDKFHPVSTNEKNSFRNRLGYAADDFIVINVAEINKNKNQIALVKILPKLKKYIPNIKILFVGYDNHPHVKDLVARYKLNSVVHFLGYRDDVNILVAMSNVLFSASKREGLSINIIEAMACDTPIVCSKNRGHNQLIDDGISGLLFSINDKKEMIERIVSIYKNHSLAMKLSAAAMEASKRFSVDIVVSQMEKIYMKCITANNISE
jgi:glycosyltransferase EpsD